VKSVIRKILLFVTLGIGCAMHVPAQPASDGVTVYEGQYNCAQGPTHLTIVAFTPDYQGVQQAVFAFSPMAENPNVPVGEFILSGRVETVPNGVLDLRQSRWIRQPAGFQMVDLMGRVSSDGKSIHGRVILTGCTDFSVKRLK
jgi:hypothetical protein